MSPDTATTASRRRTGARAQPASPPRPQSLEATGLNAGTVRELLLKALYLQGSRTGRQLTELVRLPFALVDEQLLALQQRHLVEADGSGAAGRGGYAFGLTREGRDHARDALSTNRYVGPAPVPLRQYRAWILKQSVSRLRIGRERIRDGFPDVVLEPGTFELLGPAINSATSLFLYGQPGNGKTMIAESIARLFRGLIYLPYAVEVDGEVIVLYDPVHHRSPREPDSDSEAGEAVLASPPEYDQRFARIERPVVTVGGELTLDQLDLQFDPAAKVYQAPFQMKAAGGVLILDDFGRQRVPARDLLNRWIVPLEKRVDFLSLRTGTKFPVPFDCLLVFSTNIDPAELVDEAFLRRIRYKIHIDGPDRQRFEEIFRRCCDERDIEFAPEAIDQLYDDYYGRDGIEPRGCHPRDLLDQLCDHARFVGAEPQLSRGLIDQAARSYFVALGVESADAR